MNKDLLISFKAGADLSSEPPSVSDKVVLSGGGSEDNDLRDELAFNVAADSEDPPGVQANLSKRQRKFQQMKERPLPCVPGVALKNLRGPGLHTASPRFQKVLGPPP